LAISFAFSTGIFFSGAPMSISREEATEIYEAGREAVVETIMALSATLEEANRRIDELEKRSEALEKKIAQISKNSSNSSKPPSSDITRPKGPSNTPEKRGGGSGKIGAQPGHPRHERPPTLEQNIDQFHEHSYGQCPECGGQVQLMPEREPRVLQQVEIIEVPVVQHEHRCHAVWCENCGTEHWAPLPEHVANEGLCKERLTALVAYMKHRCHASYSTIQKFLEDVLGLKVSRGYLCKLVGKVSEALEEPYEELLRRLPLETLLNVDETGHKDNGNKFWTWVFKAELYVLFKIDESRSSQVLIDVLGKEFDGALGCDYFGAYRRYMRVFGVTLQFCMAHLIRDVRYLADLPDPQTQAYGERLLEGLRGLFGTIHRREQMSPETFQRDLEAAKEDIIRTAVQTAPSQLDAEGKELKNEAQNMAKRFRKHGEAYFTFITTPGMEPTNNVAERAVRFVVIDRRITQGTRSARGRERSERLWTVIGTCAMQGRSAYQFILGAVHALFHNHSPPSLLPDSTRPSVSLAA